jgi:hypothetical protein
MLYSVEQQQWLKALGIQLFVTIPQSLTVPADSAEIKVDDFWQSQLGRNIQCVAKGIELSDLKIGSVANTKLAKRIIWQKIRLLQKS